MHITTYTSQKCSFHDFCSIWYFCFCPVNYNNKVLGVECFVKIFNKLHLHLPRTLLIFKFAHFVRNIHHLRHTCWFPRIGLARSHILRVLVASLGVIHKVRTHLRGEGFNESAILILNFLSIHFCVYTKGKGM